MFRRATRRSQTRRPGGATGCWRFYVLVGLAIAGASTRAQTQDASGPAYEITAFDVVASLREDASLQVVETIKVHFFLPRHGIVRHFPLHLPSAAGPLRRPVVRVDVDGEGAAHNRFDSDDDRTSLWLGDPQVELTGDHTYRLSYRVPHVLGGRAPEESLRWFVTGYDWNARILRSSFALVLPAHASGDGFTLQGRSGARYGSRRTLSTGARISATTLGFDATDDRPALQVVAEDVLEQGQGLSIEAHVPRGSVRLAAPAGWFERNTDAAEGLRAAQIGGATVVLFLLLLGLRALIFHTACRRALRSPALDAEPTPPLPVLDLVIMRDGRLTAAGLRMALTDLIARGAVRWIEPNFRRGNRRQLEAAGLSKAERVLCEHLPSLPVRSIPELLQSRLLETLVQELLIRSPEPGRPWFRWTLALVGALAAACCWHWGLPAGAEKGGLAFSAALCTLLTYRSKGWLLAWIPFLILVRLTCVDSDALAVLYSANMLLPPTAAQVAIVLTLWLLRAPATRHMVLYNATELGFWRWVRDQHRLPRLSRWPEAPTPTTGNIPGSMEQFVEPSWWNAIHDQPPSDFFGGGDGGAGGDSGSSSGSSADSGSSSDSGYSGGGSDW